MWKWILIASEEPSRSTGPGVPKRNIHRTRSDLPNISREFWTSEESLGSLPKSFDMLCLSDDYRVDLEQTRAVPVATKSVTGHLRNLPKNHR